MITKLLPENISTNWDLIKEAIAGALPPHVINTPEKLNRIMESTLSGELEVWVYYDNEDGIKIKSIWTTSIVVDPESQTKNLLMYSIYNYDHTEDSNWLEGLKTMNAYAISKGCSNITGFTNNEYILKFVQSVGGQTDIRFIKIPVL